MPRALRSTLRRCRWLWAIAMIPARLDALILWLRASMLSVEHRPALLEVTARWLWLSLRRLVMAGSGEVGTLHQRALSHLWLRASMLSVEDRPALLEVSARRLRLWLTVSGAPEIGALHRCALSHLRLRAVILPFEHRPAALEIAAWLLRLVISRSIKIRPLHRPAMFHLWLRATMVSVDSQTALLAVPWRWLGSVLVRGNLWRWAISALAALMVRTASFAFLFALRADCAELIRADLAIRIPVEFAQTFHGFVDFDIVDIAVVVGVDHSEQSGDRAPGISRRAVGCGFVLCVQRDAGEGERYGCDECFVCLHGACVHRVKLR